MAMSQRVGPGGGRPQHELTRQLLRQRGDGKLLEQPKRELVHRCQFATRAEARAAVFEWIEVFYNREPLYSAIGYKTPVDFENQLN